MEIVFRELDEIVLLVIDVASLIQRAVSDVAAISVRQL